MANRVIILSGGLDSTTLLYKLVEMYGNEPVYTVSFDYGQKHKKELEFARYHCDKLRVLHTVIPLEGLGKIAPSSLTRKHWPMPEGEYNSPDMKKTVVPNRNMVMLSLAASFAIGINAEYLYYGAHAGDHDIYPDCRPEFVNMMREAFKLCDYKPIHLEVPYLYMSKDLIVKNGLLLGVDYSKTMTCYNGTIPACGVCGSCNERLKAFADCGETDPLEYKV